MKITRLILFFVVVITVNVFPQVEQAESAFEKGNDFYRNENFMQAVSEYQKVLDNGFVSEELYYNLGNSYYKLGELGRAVLYYEKAVKLNPGYEDAHYNLELAYARTVDKIEAVPSLFIFEWWDSIIAFMPITGWAAWVLFCYVILLASIGIFLISKRGGLKRFSFYLGTVSLFFFIVSSVFLYSKYLRETDVTHAVLLEDTVTAKVSPLENSADAFVIHEGLKFRIEDRVDNWARIKLPDGKVGWLPQNTYGEI